MIPTCETCRYLHTLSSSCRKAPPMTFLIPGREGPTAIGAWPPVRADQWCGQHEPRLELQ